MVATFSDSRSRVVSSTGSGSWEIERPRGTPPPSAPAPTSHRQRQPDIQHQGRQRQHQHRQQHDHAERQPHVGARRVAPEPGRAQRAPSRRGRMRPPPRATAPAAGGDARGGGGTATPAARSRAACCAARGSRCRGWSRHGCGCPGYGAASPESVRAPLPPCAVRPARHAAGHGRLAAPLPGAACRADLDRIGVDLLALRQQHGAVQRVLQLAHVAAPAMSASRRCAARTAARYGRPFTSA